MSRKIRELAIPKYKKDWPGRTLLMKEDCPLTHWRAGKPGQPSLLTAGEVVTLERFLSREEARMSGWSELYRWTDEGQRVIKLSWSCPHCAHTHEDFIPESFIRQKKALFVEVIETDEEQEA
ncbi:MAG TPA: hypothetical protein H9874_04515 [Candidatus Bilophila faecipullorum]|uniref:Uncharacterized protein n=1 Tax=Candidatus Bilophila faecipullorum TaxID=2838482 RepID=A0A9D1QYR9_9BACT|nr:hypothetical protein [Candidatus Bilophila faecipullorum]